VKINLDGLNPCNTFERRLLEALTNGEVLPVNIKLETGRIEERLNALESRPSSVEVPDYFKVAALEAQIMDLMKAVQILLQAHEDEKRKTGTMRRILIELTDQIDGKLKATG
jgi:phage host-nuclease inhibitor protein Gam